MPEADVESAWHPDLREARTWVGFGLENPDGVLVWPGWSVVLTRKDGTEVASPDVYAVTPDASHLLSLARGVALPSARVYRKRFRWGRVGSPLLVAYPAGMDVGDFVAVRVERRILP